jgi:hypothetical protein
MIEERARAVHDAPSCNDGAAIDDEDWRVEVELADRGSAERLHAAAGATELYEHLRGELPQRAALTHDDNLVFAYASTREGAEAAERTLRDLAAKAQLEAGFTLTRWHPLAERWEDPDAPLPSDPAAVAEEQKEGQASEREFAATETAADKKAGIPQYEVRITLASHAEAAALARQLAAEGLPTQRHWHYLLIGAWTEDDANTLADRLRGEVPDGAEVRVETTFAFVLEQDPSAGGPRFSPFVLF